MNYLIIEENVDNDPCKFALMSRETSDRVILQAANPEIQQAWVQDINQVLDTQRDFLNGMYILLFSLFLLCFPNCDTEWGMESLCLCLLYEKNIQHFFIKEKTRAQCACH